MRGNDRVLVERKAVFAVGVFREADGILNKLISRILLIQNR